MKMIKLILSIATISGLFCSCGLLPRMSRDMSNHEQIKPYLGKIIYFKREGRLMDKSPKTNLHVVTSILDIEDYLAKVPKGTPLILNKVRSIPVNGLPNNLQGTGQLFLNGNIYNIREFLMDEDNIYKYPMSNRFSLEKLEH
jgi:hypothetical protein